MKIGGYILFVKNELMIGKVYLIRFKQVFIKANLKITKKNIIIYVKKKFRKKNIYLHIMISNPILNF